MKRKRLNETDRGQIADELEIAIQRGEREERKWALISLLFITLIAFLV